MFYPIARSRECTLSASPHRSVFPKLFAAAPAARIRRSWSLPLQGLLARGGLLGSVELSAYRLARPLKRVLGTSPLRSGWGGENAGYQNRRRLRHPCGSRGSAKRPGADAVEFARHQSAYLKWHHRRRPQETAQRLQILENTIQASESGKHGTAQKRFTLLPIRFPAFCPVHVLRPCSSAAKRSEAAGEN